MLVRGLIAALDYAQSPGAVRAATWALEKATGISTTQLIQMKASSVTFDGMNYAEWYQREGFYQVASRLGFNHSNTGFVVTPDLALTNPVIYAGSKIIAEDMGSMPFFLYEKGGQDLDRTEKATRHPLYYALHDLVNPDLSAGEFVEMLTAHAVLGLDGFAEHERTGSSFVLRPWMPAEVTIDLNSRGSKVYIRKWGNSQEKTFRPDQVFHLRGFTWNGERGDPILERAKDAIGLGVAAQTYAANFFKHDASTGIILTRPATGPGSKPLDKTQVELMKDAWKKWHQGIGRAHEPAILQDGITATRLDPDHQKLQLIEQRKFAVIEGCRVLRLSPHKLADLDRSTFSNIEHLEIEHVTHTLGAWVRRWRQAVHRCLLTFDEQRAGRLYAEHEVAVMLRGDFAGQSEGFRKLLEKGVYSINEVRRLLNFNPIAGGDDHFIQLNLATVQDVASGATLPGAGSTGAVRVGSAA